MLTFYFLSNSTPEHGKTLSRAGELLTNKANEISARLQPESSFESIIIAATLLPADWIRFKEKVA